MTKSSSGTKVTFELILDNNTQFDNIQEKLTKIFKYFSSFIKFRNIAQIKTDREAELAEVKGSKEVNEVDSGVQTPLTGPKLMSKRIIGLLDQQAEERREIENKLLGILDEKATKIRAEIAQESKARFESIDALKFQDTLTQDYTQYDEVDNEIMKRIEQETTRFDEALEDQKASLGETEKAMNEIITDMRDKIKKEIQDEKKIREENEEMLLGLLENTCDKLTPQDE